MLSFVQLLDCDVLSTVPLALIFVGVSIGDERVITYIILVDPYG